MATANLTVLEQKLDYKFNDKKLGQLALTAAGAIRIGHDGNKNLALLGDKIMYSIIVLNLFDTKLDKASITNVANRLTANTNLHEIFKSTKISSLLTINPAQWGAAIGEKTGSATIEAIIGAVFIDSGLRVDITRGVMEKLGLTVPTSMVGMV